MVPRPDYHFTPPHMWLNDPNGLVYFEGEYHLFYQYHPESTVWGPMHWGHAVSRDLVNWGHLPIALYPDEQGMIFSGSAVVDWENTSGFGLNGEPPLVAIYTTHSMEQTQNIAYSSDRGRTWTKYAGNPVLTIGSSEFRDPKVFWHESTKQWIMVTVLADQHKVRMDGSPDLKNWSHISEFGPAGNTGGVWECPDLFELPLADGSGTRWVLMVGVGDGAPAGGSGTQYFIGQFDGRAFISENPKDVTLWADFGADYYAPQSWSDEPQGRRLMLGWMSNWQYARLVPATDWRGVFSVIRELSLRRTEQGIRLIHKPIPELQTLRGRRDHWQDEVIQPAKNRLANMHGTSLEIIAEFKITPETEGFGFRVRAGADEHTTIRYMVKDKKLIVDRTRSGTVDFQVDFARIHSADLVPINGVIHLHLFVDSTSVEVFANDGLVTFTESIFPAKESQGLELFAEGGAVILNSLDVYQLKPAIFQSIGS